MSSSSSTETGGAGAMPALSDSIEITVKNVGGLDGVMFRAGDVVALTAPGMSRELAEDLIARGWAGWSVRQAESIAAAPVDDDPDEFDLDPPEAEPAEFEPPKMFQPQAKRRGPRKA